MIEQQPTGEKSPAVGDVDRQAREAMALAEIGRAVSESERLDDLYEQVAACIRGLVPADRIVIAVVDPSTQELHRDFISGSAGSRPRAGPLGQTIKAGILDEIRATGKAAKFDDLPRVVDRYPGVANMVRSGFKSGICTPLTVRGEVVGVLGAGVRTPAAYTDADLDLLGRIANHVAGAVSSALLRRQGAQDIRESELLAEIGMAVGSTLDLEVALDRVFAKLQDLVPADRVSMIVTEGKRGSRGFVHSIGATISPPPGPSAGNPSADGLPVLVAASGDSRIVNDLKDVLEEAPGTSVWSRRG